MTQFIDLDPSAQPEWARSLSSVMVRSLDGHIQYWNRACERKYGWSSGHAVGAVSHSLLNTVFPQPLDEINNELVSKGFWEGYLLHTLSDGSRVKVLSRWELVGSSSSKTCVVEVNEKFARVTPDSAHLLSTHSFGSRLARLLIKERYWWMISAALTLVLAELVLEFTDGIESMPMLVP